MSLEETIKSTINLFRYIFEHDKALLKTIDESYEKILLEDLTFVPKDVEQYVLNYVNMVTTAYQCFDIQRFNNILNSMPNEAFPQFNMNSYELFTQGLSKINLSKVDKARVTNMVSKFRPLFVCFDRIINNTKFAINRLAERSSIHSFDDLL